MALYWMAGGLGYELTGADVCGARVPDPATHRPSECGSAWGLAPPKRWLGAVDSSKAAVRERQEVAGPKVRPRARERSFEANTALANGCSAGVLPLRANGDRPKVGLARNARRRVLGWTRPARAAHRWRPRHRPPRQSGDRRCSGSGRVAALAARIAASGSRSAAGRQLLAGLLGRADDDGRCRVGPRSFPLPSFRASSSPRRCRRWGLPSRATSAWRWTRRSGAGFGK